MFRKEPQAFIALPAESKGSDLRSVIEDALHQHDIRTVLAQEAASSSASFGIQEMLRDSDFVIADITGANPNVMIEVGMALGMGKRLLLLSQGRSSDLPFDLAAIQVAVYRPDDVGSVQKYLDLWLRDTLSEREASRA